MKEKRGEKLATVG